MKLSNIKNISSKGFTLIELLIVMAVLGILAAVVIVAMNPAENLARGRDSSRLQQIASLGHAMAAYQTTQGAIPAVSNTWQNTMLASGDLKAVIAYNAAGATVVGPAANCHSNVCYAPNALLTEFMIWGGVESNMYRIRANAGAACAAGNSAYFIFDSTQGRSGVACVATSTAPAAGIVLR